MSLKAKLLYEIASSPRRPKYLKAKFGNNKKLYEKLEELVTAGRIKKCDGTYHIVNDKKFKKAVPAPVQVRAGITCTLVKLAKNFGFATPTDGSGDVFIPGRFLMGAMQGDEIQVVLFASPQRPGSREGEVVSVVKENNRVVGTVEKLAGKLFLVPDNCNQTYLQIKKNADGGVKMGEKAAGEIIERATSHDGHRVGITMRFGSADCAKECARAILYGAGIEKTFSDKVRAEARKYDNAVVDIADIGKRRDLRNEKVFTIDSAQTKDIDDAISAKETETGFTLGVHIADVSHYVKENSPLDKEAFKRGTSVYYAQSVVPMLPRQLSNGICSLNEKVDRLAFSCIIELDKNCKVTDYTFVKTVINSKVKGVYSEINAIFADEATEETKQKYEQVSDTLVVMRKMYDLLADRRAQRGSMDIESGEAKIIVNEDGLCVGIEKRTGGISESMIEEFMLLANGCAANLARRMEVPFVYRIHEQPALDRVASLRNVLTALGLQADFEEEIPNQQELSKLLDAARGTGLERAVHMNILRTMSKAKYAKEAKGHYGLVLEDYSHFTSPIRRYPDLAIHRILTDIVNGADKAELCESYDTFAQTASEQSSRQEVAAMQAERNCEDCYKAEYMRQFIGQEFLAVISSVTAHGMYVELDNTIEGLIRNTSISAEPLVLNEGVSITEQLSKRNYRVGDQIKVVLSAVDVAQGNIDFDIAKV